jgi:hypothetical protein
MFFRKIEGAIVGFQMQALHINDSSVPRDADWDIQAAGTALDLYRTVLWRARLGRWWSTLTRRPHSLLSLNEVITTDIDRGNQFVRMCTVPIRQIRGSEGRSEDFDADFYPLQKRTRGRWLSVATAYLKGVAMPPVELIQVGSIYYVRDGHHRISVARATGQEYIEAQVTVWEGDKLPSLTYQDWNCHVLVHQDNKARASV